MYHDDLTDAFLGTLKRLMTMGCEKLAFISLEKRYIITSSENVKPLIEPHVLWLIDLCSPLTTWM